MNKTEKKERNMADITIIINYHHTFNMLAPINKHTTRWKQQTLLDDKWIIDKVSQVTDALS